MFNQAEILSDVIRHEHARAMAPAHLERRRIAQDLEALHCCAGPSLLARLRSVLDGPAAICCAAG
jgi:hypothetical protein